MLLWLAPVDYVSNVDNFPTVRSSRLFGLIGVGVLPGLDAGAHGFPAELESVGIVKEAVQDGVRVGGIADLVMPAVHGNLRGNDRRAATMAIIDDLHQVAALLGGELHHRPVVKDQDADAGEVPQGSGLAAVEARHGQIVEQTREPFVEHGEAITRGPVAQRTTYPRLADSSQSHDILRKNNPSRLSSGIRIIRAAASASLPSGALFMRTASTL
jgi:hypothetical protein